MSFLFSKPKTPQELLRENKRSIDRAVRELDRERMSLQAQEKKVIAEIKKTAKTGQMIMAKDLVRTRQYITKFYEMKCQMQAVGLRLQVEGLRALLMLQTMKSTAAMVDAMKGVTKAMMQMNRSVNLPQMQRIMQEFEKQSEVMEMKQELMNDTMDDVMEDESSEAEQSAIVDQVLGEIGIELGAAAKTPAAAQEMQMDADLEERLNKLRNS